MDPLKILKERPTAGVTRWWAGLGTIPALSRDGTTPFCRNQPQATQPVQKRARREAAVLPARPDCQIGRVEGGARRVGRIHKHNNRYGFSEGLPVDRKISTNVTPRSSSSKM